MPQQDARKNYIGIVSDTADEEHIANSALRAQPHVVSYLFGRLAAALGRARNGAAGRTTNGWARPASAHLKRIMKTSF